MQNFALFKMGIFDTIFDKMLHFQIAQSILRVVYASVEFFVMVKPALFLHAKNVKACKFFSVLNEPTRLTEQVALTKI